MSVAVDFGHRAGEFSVEAKFGAAPGVTVLFGPSGSGKSLTLAVVAGLLRPDRGHVEIDGVTVADAATRIHLPTQDRNVGVVFQEALLLPHRSALDNVALAVRKGRKAERRNAARGWLERVGAGGLAAARPRTLSGGERQRVALARALAGEPKVLLLDEPLSALDHPTRRQLRTLLRKLVDDTGVPALLVTHDPDEAEALADRVVHFEPGRTVREVKRPPEAG